MTASIYCTNRGLTKNSDDLLELQSYSALSEMHNLLYIATPDGYSSSLRSHTFPTDRKGAETVAGWLGSACEEMAAGVGSIGYLLSGLDSESPPREIMGIGSVLMLLGDLMQAARGGSENLKFYAEQLKAAGLDSPPERVNQGSRT